MVSRKVTIRKFKTLYFRNERRHGTGNLKKHLFLSQLAILILEFDDVIVKTIHCFLSSLEEVQ